MRNNILLFVYGFSYLLYFNLYNNNMYLIKNGDADSKGNSKQLDSSEVNSYPEPEQDPEQDPNSGPEQDPNEDDFIQKSINNNNLITIEHKHKLSEKYQLNLSDLNYSSASPLYNFLRDKNTLLKEFRNKSGIYLIHNNINGKKYIGSGMDLSKRLATYYFPSRLCDGRYISNSILKYGHGSFSVVVLDILSNTSTSIKKDIISKEQQCINLYKPVYNLNPIAGSSMGFKHSEESKRLISEFRIGKPLSDETKKKLSALFSGELNPFWSKVHSTVTLEKMSKSKVGTLNPMFNKEKSKEFLEHMYKDRKGSNNPMFGKIKSKETLEKMSKKVYVYDSNKEFIILYDSIKFAVKDLHIAAETINKYLDTDKIYKNKYFYSKLK